LVYPSYGSTFPWRTSPLLTMTLAMTLAKAVAPENIETSR
jgi:hypothetical protein